MLLQSLLLPLLDLSRTSKRAIVIMIDASLCVLTIWLAFYLRLGTFISLSGTALWATLASIVIALPVFTLFGLYRTIFRHSGWATLAVVTRAIAVYTLLYAAIFTAIGFQGVPRTLGLIQPTLLLLAVVFSRVVARTWLGGIDQNKSPLEVVPNVLIYRASSGGRQLADALAHGHDMRVRGFLDDDVELHGQVLNGLPIYNPSDCAQWINALDISILLLADTTTGRHKQEILEQMLKLGVAVRSLPSMSALAQGKISVSNLRRLDIDDLLGREPVTPHPLLLSENIAHRVVMVTGAGGSIGSELCRQILKIVPSVLLLVECSESALYNIHQELQAIDTRIQQVPLLASVCDATRMQNIIATWQPHTIYHAAAYKHVPLVEHNQLEGIKINVWGTLITAKIAAQYGVKRFVLISTDKAVRPSNIMGASKRLAEMTLQALAHTMPLSSCFCIVRFGNVLGSSGSVVPKFRQQIRDGGPITLTDADMTRYFMTIIEAAQLVIQAGAMAQGGEVFVLDMGEPVKISDLARLMVELSGLTIRDAEHPEGDIEIRVTGLRPGEKLYEELLIGNQPLPTLHPRIMKAHEEYLLWPVLEEKLKELELKINHNDIKAVRQLLKSLHLGYVCNEEIVDWVYLAQRSGT